MLKIVIAVVLLSCAVVFLFSVLPSCEELGLTASQGNPMECVFPQPK